MRKGRILKVVICAIALIFIDGLFHCPVLRAMPRFMEWYDASPDAKPEMKSKCTLCHINNDGSGSLNEFGQAFAEHGYRFTPELRQAYPDMFAGASGAAPTTVAQTFDAKKFFMDHCAACHGNDGKGALGNTPDFTDASWNQSKSDTELVETIKAGRGLMPTWKEKLSSEQIQAMVKFVRQFARK
ncbi:MAG: c-type cytochrome [Acidobacteria bacterium]|nr:c-type cytochrome [Acidobacteriota bacterium]